MGEVHEWWDTSLPACSLRLWLFLLSGRGVLLGGSEVVNCLAKGSLDCKMIASNLCVVSSTVC